MWRNVASLSDPTSFLVKEQIKYQLASWSHLHLLLALVWVSFAPYKPGEYRQQQWLGHLLHSSFSLWQLGSYSFILNS